MIVIRQAQLALFAAERRRAVIGRLCLYLRAQFPAELAATGDGALRRQTGMALARAASYGLSAERDCCRYLNLAVLYGWDFDQRDDTAWMRACLVDGQITSPAGRLQRLVELCLQRRAQQAQRRRLHLGAGLDDDDEHDEDWQLAGPDGKEGP